MLWWLLTQGAPHEVSDSVTDPHRTGTLETTFPAVDLSRVGGPQRVTSDSDLDLAEAGHPDVGSVQKENFKEEIQVLCMWHAPAAVERTCPLPPCPLTSSCFLLSDLDLLVLCARPVCLSS